MTAMSPSLHLRPMPDGVELLFEGFISRSPF
jgi:hypothetical protein